MSNHCYPASEIKTIKKVHVDIEVRDELDDENDDQEEVGESEIDSASYPDGDT